MRFDFKDLMNFFLALIGINSVRSLIIIFLILFFSRFGLMVIIIRLGIFSDFNESFFLYDLFNNSRIVDAFFHQCGKFCTCCTEIFNENSIFSCTTIALNRIRNKKTNEKDDIKTWASVLFHICILCYHNC